MPVVLKPDGRTLSHSGIPSTGGAPFLSLLLLTSGFDEQAKPGALSLNVHWLGRDQSDGLIDPTP